MPFYPKIGSSSGGGGGGAANSIWTKYSYPVGTFTAPGNNRTVNIYTANRQVVQGIIIGLVTPFSRVSGAVTSVQISLGTDITNPAELAGGLECLDLAGAAADDTQSTNTVQEVGLYAAEVVTISVLSAGGNLNTLTGGAVDVWICTADLPA